MHCKETIHVEKVVGKHQKLIFRINPIEFREIRVEITPKVLDVII